MLLNIYPNPNIINTNNEYRVNSVAILYEHTTIYQAGTVAVLAGGRRDVRAAAMKFCCPHTVYCYEHK